jgi:hypothetical protein
MKKGFKYFPVALKFISEKKYIPGMYLDGTDPR